MKISNFINQIFSNKKDKQELSQLTNWVEENKLLADDLQKMSAIYSASDDMKNYESFDSENSYLQIEREIDSPQSDSKTNWLRIVLLAILGCLIAYLGYNYFTTPTVYHASNDVKIEMNDGSFIQLEKNALVTSNFNETEWQVEGMATFEITKQKDGPINIVMPLATLEVLGTKFFVVSNQSENIIDLHEGHLRVITKDGKSKDFFGGQRATVNNNAIVIENLKELNKIYLSYTNAYLVKVVDELENIFEIEIQPDSFDESIRINATFHNQPISDILKELALISGVELSVK